jgi:hypothetical protein
VLLDDVIARAPVEVVPVADLVLPRNKQDVTRLTWCVIFHTFRPKMVASKTSVPETTPWMSQAYFRPRRASVMWPSR